MGFLWSILTPLVTVFIFKFVFSTILRASIEHYPFFIYLMTAVFPWTYFSASVGGATESIFSNQDLIKKAYFPRQIIPVSVVLANLINFLPALVVMFLILALFRMQFTFFILLMPFIVLLQTIFTVGLVLIVSSLQVIVRDVKYVVELSLMAWFYLSPGLYTLTTIANFSEKFLEFYVLNPFVGLFILYRIALLKGYAETLPESINILSLTILTVIVCSAVFFLGFFVFKKYEPQFADLV